VSTHDQVVDVLVKARAAVAEAGVEAELRQVAYAKAVELLGSTGERTPAGAAPGGGMTTQVQAAPHRASSLIEALSTRLRLDADLLHDIYEERDGDVSLVVSKTMLPGAATKAAAMRDVALLVAAGRQGAGQEEWTAFKRIREECEELGVLDRVNFATEVGKLGMRAQGTQKAREVRLARHHFEQAAELVAQISRRATGQ
jgi:hypothetical protein